MLPIQANNNYYYSVKIFTDNEPKRCTFTIYTFDRIPLAQIDYVDNRPVVIHIIATSESFARFRKDLNTLLKELKLISSVYKINESDEENIIFNLFP